MKLDFYVDAYFARIWKHEDDQYPMCMKSSSGYVMTLGGCKFHWLSNIHKYLSISTLESEYIDLYQVMRDLLTLSLLLQKVGNNFKIDFVPPIIMHYTVFEDNNGALGLDT